MSAKDLYIQNITVAENDGHSDSFQVKFPNVFTNYPLGGVRVEDQRFKDWDYYKFTIWQSQLNFVVLTSKKYKKKLLKCYELLDKITTSLAAFETLISLSIDDNSAIDAKEFHKL